MQDMTTVITPKSDQINADDLIAGPRTIKIREVQIKGGQEQPVSIYFDGSDKAFRPCKSMCRVLVAGWGPDAKACVGRSLTLYRDPDVKWAGMAVGGIRVSHMSDLAGPLTLALTASKGSRKPVTIRPLVIDQTKPEFTSHDYGSSREALEEAAQQGTEALKRAWGDIGPKAQKALVGEMPNLKAIAETVDSRPAAH